MLALRLAAAACLMALAGGAGSFATAEEHASPTSLPLTNDAVHLEAACSVCAHSAKADGVHDDGPAVQAALASCSEVVIPAEGCGTATAAASSAAALFLVGPVVIPSDRTLRILGNVSTLPPERWPLVQNKSLADCTVKTCMHRHLFNAASARNITVTGSGTIEGGGLAWWQLYAEGKLRAHRPMLVNLGGDDLTLSDITIRNPPMEGASLSSGRKHRVHGYKASVDIPGLQAIREMQPRRMMLESANAACLMLSDASDVHVSHVHLVCGDDNIAMNAGSREFKDVVIEKSYFGWGHGCSIGSMTQAGLKNITVRDIVWNGTSAGIRVKSYVGGGGDVEISGQNLTLHGVENPIDLDQHYPRPCVPHCNATKKPAYKVELCGMHADGIPKADLGPYLNGSSTADGKSVAIVLTVSNSTFTAADGKPAAWRCENAHIIAQDVSPMPGACPQKTRAALELQLGGAAEPRHAAEASDR